MLILDYGTFGDEYIEIAKNAAPHCDSIRFRAKELNAAQVYEKAAALRDALPESRLFLSEYADMALALGYNGVQLGENSLPVNAAKSTFPELSVGYSAHSSDECVNIHADFFTLSPVFYTPKPYEVTPLGAIPAPAPNVYALGGINKDNAAELNGLGYCGLAGISFHKDLEEIRKIIDQ